ncbi:hypothetical protein [Amycolatopsis sp. CA-126428]|uniref:hypothetical protein n=1 Tax=Amycolatopsis sp. CA-126428 TaxID=2073158 RepID=UPI0011B05731|nr:hypothetical protein [Amycolatopsis sp. CA-126428]
MSFDELAERHSLVLYDPQGGAVYAPPAARGDPVLVLSSCDGSRIENPGAADIAAALGRLSAENWFAVLDRGDHYIQAGFGEQAAARGGWFALEHREGLPHRHFRRRRRGAVPRYNLTPGPRSAWSGARQGRGARPRKVSLSRAAVPAPGFPVSPAPPRRRGRPAP